ncbi:Xyloglucan endotransglucosylase/hydrolase protein 3 [Linum grandiflorum]
MTKSTVPNQVLLIISLVVLNIAHHGQTRFQDDFVVTWGLEHFQLLNNGTEVQLTLDGVKGGAGFESKRSYGSGVFHVKMKVPKKNSTGVITAFYVNPGQDELDFEMLGGPDDGSPISMQTNMFINGVGGREQHVHLWFDPTADFHDYTILWNQHQILFSVDEVPIRVIRKSDVTEYPSTKAMTVVASLWNGEWMGKVNWSYAPFVANFKDFGLDGCPAVEGSDLAPCFSSPEVYWWNSEEYWTLDSVQEKAYEDITFQYMGFNYCDVKTPLPPECDR